MHVLTYSVHVVDTISTLTVPLFRQAANPAFGSVWLELLLKTQYQLSQGKINSPDRYTIMLTCTREWLPVTGPHSPTGRQSFTHQANPKVSGAVAEYHYPTKPINNTHACTLRAVYQLHMYIAIMCIHHHSCTSN